MTDRGKFIGVVAALACIGAGVMMLLFQSADSTSYSFTGNNFFESLSHGAGLYFVGKGLFVARSLHLAEQTAEALRELVNFAAHDHERATRRSEPPES